MEILQISDLHLRGDGKLSFRKVDTPACLRTAAAYLHALNRMPDAIVITGDLADSGDEHAYHMLYEALGDLPVPIYAVPGNCDFRPGEPAERLLVLEGRRILMCHGHTYGVKQSLVTAGFAAEEQQLDLFLFGHTHRTLVDRRGRTLFLNPGAIGDALRPSYATVTIRDGQLDGRTWWLT